MIKKFNRRIINNKRNRIDDERPIFKSKHQYNGIVHASIKRENNINKRREKEIRNNELKIFIHDLSVSSSPASLRKLHRFTEKMDMTIFDHKRETTYI